MVDISDRCSRNSIQKEKTEPDWLLERTGFEPPSPVDLVECILLSIHLAII
jgi:hypothetical protein